MSPFSEPSQPDPPSPCVGVCKMNPRTSLCEGCFRSLDEIAGWSSYSPARKQTVLDAIDARCERMLNGKPLA